MALKCRAALVTLADRTDDILVRFYTELLGQEPVQWVPSVYAEFHLPGLRLGIFNPKRSHQVEFASSSRGGMSLCIEVERLEDAIAAVHHAYTSMHLPLPKQPTLSDIIIASHGREVYAYDPNGNRLILHEGN
jgi:catechol 2,3-dioxygenase-like lactoylglutathione lyase family enzyme